MLQFRNINISYIILEYLRSYFASNKDGLISVLYKYLICLLYPLQAYIDNYDRVRRKKYLIGICKFQIGQLSNMLNYIYDTESIYCEQINEKSNYLKDISVESSIFVKDINHVVDAGIFYYDINDVTYTSKPTIYVSANIYDDIKDDITATVTQIAPVGLNYIIQAY